MESCRGGSPGRVASGADSQLYCLMTKITFPSRVGMLLVGVLFSVLLSSCAKIVPGNEVIVSVRDQRMMVLKEGAPVKSYRISTSKFGLGDKPGSMNTPLGTMRIARKIGAGAPSGAVFKSRRPTGEILRPNSPGRDPIVSRIIWLKGTEKRNRNAFRRYIYIHGTPEEIAARTSSHRPVKVQRYAGARINRKGEQPVTTSSLQGLWWLFRAY